MKIDANDPRWTAYALGELTDEGEIAEMESILAESSEMRRLVEEIRQTAGMLKEEFQAEPPLHLTHAQREKIEEKSKPGVSWFGLKPAWAMAGAAAVLVMISFVTFWELGKETGLERTQTAALVEEQSPAATKLDLESGIEAEVREAAKENLISEGAALSKPEQEEPQAFRQAAKQTGETGRERDETQSRTLADSNSAAAPELPEIPKFAVLEGTITDASGYALPGATVEVIDNSTGEAKRVETNEAGQYSFQELSPGSHSLKAELPGFKTKTVSNVALNTESANRQDVDLDVGGVSTTVEISANAPKLLAESSAVATALREEPMREMPMLSDFSNFLTAQEGIVQSEMVVGDARRYPRPRPRGDERFPMPRQKDRFNTESYDHISDNPFLNVTENPLSTFSIDVDTASYSNVRRFLDGGSLPPKDAVRIEELVNYFDYDYRGPKDSKPFAVNFEITEAPWNPEHRLLRIGLKGREIDSGERPDSNLVFLLDVSGSMRADNKLPLVKQSMRLLVGRLTESDRVAIVVYAGNTRMVLPSTRGDQKGKLLRAIDSLHAGGSTNGASGIQLAYETAQREFIEGGINRVILATDGDFNVGMTSRGDLTRLIEEKAETGIYLSALGFGMGNYKDSTLELLADKGRGNYAYIDTINEAKKVLVEQTNATLVPIAKDVKIQVEFNPQHVGAYRLIGYEDRVMPKEDFNDDAKKAGVIGAGHTVTALYELVPAGASQKEPGVDPLKYQKPAQPSSAARSDELLTVKIRSKEPEKDVSVLSEFAVKESEKSFKDASEDFKFAAAVAAFGMVLRDSPHRGSADLEDALEWAKEGKGDDLHGYRHEFIRLIHRAISVNY